MKIVPKVHLFSVNAGFVNSRQVFRVYTFWFRQRINLNAKVLEARYCKAEKVSVISE